MKWHVLTLTLAGLTGVMTFAGCSTTGGTAPVRSETAQVTRPAETEEREGNRGEWNRTPEVGMTKEQVLQRYGSPLEIQQTPKGEVWVYRPKRSGRDFIPVYGGFTRQYKGGEIGFGADGLVKGYKWGTKRWTSW